VLTVNLSTNFISLSPTNICSVKHEVKRYQSTKMYQPSNFQGEGRKKRVFKTTVNHLISHMVGFCGLKNHIYRVFQEEWTKLRESVPYVKIYRYNPKHLCPKLKGYGDNGQRSLKL
jgi:hypothetical protein